MNLVENVYKIAEDFMKDPEWVEMNYENIERVAQNMLLAGQSSFPFLKIKDSLVGIILELVAASINYCYWYGKSTIRPNGASSTFMYELLMQSFYDFETADKKHFSICIDRLKRSLAISRFPLLEERIKHLNELKSYAIDYCIGIDYRYNIGIGYDELPYFFTSLIESFPGFASDIFLKRASLFFIQLFRRFGWLADELKFVHVPADYQIPKMLENFNCIIYHPSLEISIETDQLIPKNSKVECEIRSATILTIRELCKLTDWNVADVDAYFFTKRHIAQQKFHLTITTDY